MEKREYIDPIHKSTKTREKYEQFNKAGSQRKIIFKNQVKRIEKNTPVCQNVFYTQIPKINGQRWFS